MRLDFISILALVAGLISVLSSPSRAQDARGDYERRSFHADVEVDPVAYVLNGYSVHVGMGSERVRVDLGAFAVDMPSFLEPNEHLDTSVNGFGLKLQYFPFAEQTGGFAGVQAELVHQLIESKLSDAAVRERQLNFGVHVGWRFLLGEFFITPWLLLPFSPFGDDVTIDGETVEAQAVSAPFPFVHLGYRFR